MTKVWLIRCKNDGTLTWGSSMTWPVEDVVGQVDDPLASLRDVPVIVDVMLMNRRNNKMAMWHKVNATFQRETPEDQESPVRAPGPLVLTVMEKDMKFQHVVRLIKATPGDAGATRLGFTLEVRTAESVSYSDFRVLLKSLDWV